MSDEMIVEFCSPTLAGIKTGNLFSCVYSDYKELITDMNRVNGILVKKGINQVSKSQSSYLHILSILPEKRSL